MDAQDLLGQLFAGRTGLEFEPVGSMTEDQIKEMKEIKSLFAKSKSIIREAEARRDMFYVKLEKQTGLLDRRVYVDLDDCMVYAEKVEKKG